MPFVARLLLFACAFRDYFAEALQLDLRGNPLNIHVYAFNKPDWHTPPCWEVFKNLSGSPTQLAVAYFDVRMRKAYTEEPRNYSYYDCAESGNRYQWPTGANVKSCNELNAAEAGPVFIGLHENSDHSVDLPEEVKTFLRGRKDSGGRVVFVSESGPRGGISGRDTSKGEQWYQHMPFRFSTWKLISMLPSIPPPDTPNFTKDAGGAESIMYAVTQALKDTVFAPAAAAGAGGGPPPSSRPWPPSPSRPPQPSRPLPPPPPSTSPPPRLRHSRSTDTSGNARSNPYDFDG